MPFFNLGISALKIWQCHDHEPLCSSEFTQNVIPRLNPYLTKASQHKVPSLLYNWTISTGFEWYQLAKKNFCALKLNHTPKSSNGLPPHKTKLSVNVHNVSVWTFHSRLSDSVPLESCRWCDRVLLLLHYLWLSRSFPNHGKTLHTPSLFLKQADIWESYQFQFVEMRSIIQV